MSLRLDLLCQRVSLVESVVVDEQYVDPAVRVDRDPRARKHHSDFVLIS